MSAKVLVFENCWQCPYIHICMEIKVLPLTGIPDSCKLPELPFSLEPETPSYQTNKPQGEYLAYTHGYYAGWNKFHDIILERSRKITNIEDDY